MKKPVYNQAQIDYDERDTEKATVFESTVFPFALEKRFYHFCLIRQPALARFIFKYALFSLLFFFGFVGRERYLAVRWSFLRSVDPLSERLDLFFRKKNKRLFFPFEGMTIYSAHPDIVLRDICDRHGAKLFANRYITYFSKFRDYKTPAEMYDGEGELYDLLASPLRKKARFFFPIVGRKIYVTVARARLARLISAVLTALVLIASSAALCALSLYYGCLHSSDSQKIFLSYFENPLIPLLNLLPILTIILFVYFLSNRLWLSFFLTSAVITALSWTNFYKLFFRNDPAVADDLLTLREAGNMTGKYVPFFDSVQYITLGAIVVLTLLFVFVPRARIRSGRLRLILLVAVAASSVLLFNTVYLDEGIYEKTDNDCECLQKNSPTDRFVGRGFLYPGLHSFRSLIDPAPEGYDDDEAKEILDEYTDAAIPKDERVNIISVMFEAGADLSNFEEIEFTRDVYAPLHELEEESYSGQLVTNIFGGGTVDTERAFISGYSSRPSFADCTNSYAWYFRDLGYTVEGSHPSFNWFYNRKNANKNIGFENYYFSEDTYYDLSGTYYTSDAVLFPQIIKFYEEADRDKPYFSFNITYQGHGPYSEENVHDVKYIKQGGLSDENYYALTNYLYEVESTLDALDDFVDYFRDCDEPVVLILFGDHLPGLESAFEELGINMNHDTTEGFLNYYSTPYIIWANEEAKEALDCEFEGEGESISPCFLMSEFFELVGWRGDAYMQISCETKEILPVITESGLYIQNGEVTASLSTEAEEKLNRFRYAQYYRKKNFRK